VGEEKKRLMAMIQQLQSGLSRGLPAHDEQTIDT